MKILALDIGDVWTGTAISDPTATFARPYQTVKTTELEQFLAEKIKIENLEKIVVGHPKTLKGTESEQTKKIKEHKEKLEKKFSSVSWILWDERLTSKMAAKSKKRKSNTSSKKIRQAQAEDKIKSHSIAAAFILDSYLIYLQTNEKMQR